MRSVGRICVGRGRPERKCGIFFCACGARPECWKGRIGSAARRLVHVQHALRCALPPARGERGDLSVVEGWPRHHLCRIPAACGALCPCAVGQRRRTRRPGRPAGEEVARGAGRLCRLRGGRGGVPAAQHRLYAGRGGLFRHRCGRQAADLRRRGVRGPRTGGGKSGGGPADARCRRHRHACRSRPRPARNLRARRARAGRPRRLPLHLRHHRALQGRHAHAGQPSFQRRGAGGCLALHRRGRSAARTADLPHARPVRGHQRHPAGRRVDDLPARPRHGRPGGGHAARHLDDGRAHLLHPPAGRPAPGPGADRPYAAVRVRLGAAAGRDPPRLRGAHGQEDPRTLRHDRNQHEHLQPYNGERRAGTWACRCRGELRIVDAETGARWRGARSASSR